MSDPLWNPPHDDLDKLLSGKSADQHWDKPGKCSVRFMTALGTMWISRRSIVSCLQGEIDVIRANHIDGINEYWDTTKIEYLQRLQQMLTELSHESGEEVTHE